ncbi:MAG: Gfo/Idh/MocA family oxidoreductase [Sphingomonadales bacterium]
MRAKQPQKLGADAVGVAIVGAGERGVYYIGTQIAALCQELGLYVTGVHDRLPDRAHLGASYLTDLYRQGGIDHAVARYDNLDAVLADPKVDIVVVTTHTNQHRVPVLRALDAGKKVYLDKPIAVSLDDALAIQAAERRHRRPVIMGFTRRYEKPWVEMAKLLRAGAIGDLQMMLLRSVIPYSRYLQLWHRDQRLSGGALNDKSSHHFDVLNWFASSVCETVTALGGRSGVFKPDPNAPTRCRECDRDCPYRFRAGLIDYEEGRQQPPNRSWADAADPIDWDDACVYAPGADIDDHAIVSLGYRNGVKASLFFTIFGPYAPDQETFELVGASGRMRLERASGSIDLIADHGARRETIRFEDPDQSTSHYGADRHLVRALRAFHDGAVPPVGVDEGIASLRLVLAAQQSLRQNGIPVFPQQLGAELKQANLD